MSFHQYSKQIIEDYLGTVAYVDDLIFSNNKETKALNLGEADIKVVSAANTASEKVENRKESQPLKQLIPNINPLAFTNAFLKKGIHCALLELSEDKSNIDFIKKTLKKSDVIILDWQMHNDLGQSACELIKHLLQDEKDSYLSLKLLIIYTDQPVYNSLIEENLVPIFKELNISFNLDSDTVLKSGHSKIIVLQKPVLNVNEVGKVSIEDLPERIIEELSNMTEGLVSSIAIESISSVRKNIHRLLAVYSNQLDPAYLSHKALLSNTEDSKEQIMELLGSEIKSIIKSTVNFDEKKILPLYFDQYYKNFSTDFILPDKDKLTIKLPEKLDGEMLLKITEVGIEKYFTKSDDPIEQVILFSRNCHKNLTSFFTNCQDKAKEANKKYAIITTLKSLTDIGEKQLTLGTIVIEDKKTQPKYWLCVQPKCDSIRIETQKRDFIFLRLFNGKEDKFDIILADGEKLKIDYRVYFSSLISFKSNENAKVTSYKEGDLFKFEKGDNQKMIWKGELKNDFAQYVSQKFSSQLSRVAVEHFEWLRRSSNA